jgi:hypothetical protein
MRENNAHLNILAPEETGKPTRNIQNTLALGKPHWLCWQELR